MTNHAKKNLFLSQLVEGTTNIPLIGWIVWWNLSNVSLTKEQFEQALTQAGLDKKFAKDHNYRCAYIRALHSMEEDRIIRLVEEDNLKLVYQFTAEHLIEGLDEKSLEYTKETLIVIDKVIYRNSENFSKAITKCSPAIKVKIVELFEQHKQLYKTADLTRYLQRILTSEAEIISLRPQGSVYFIPAGYKPVLDKVASLIQQIGGGSHLEFAPMPAVESSKNMIKNALGSELDSMFKRMEGEIEEALKSNKGVSEVWSKTRIGRMQNVLDRISKYVDGGILSDIEHQTWRTNMKELEKKVLGVRKLDL